MSIVILCVEDEPEVRDAIVRDLEPFAGHFRIEAAEDVEDARQVLADCNQDRDTVGLVLCDHVLPGQQGVEFLIELDHDPATASMRKVLITGQAGQVDTIKAINNAHLNHYIAKPWTAEDLQDVVRSQLTEYVLGQPESLLPYVEVLDGPRLLEAIASRRSDT